MRHGMAIWWYRVQLALTICAHLDAGVQGCICGLKLGPEALHGRIHQDRK